MTYVNLLRTQTEAMSATIGVVDSLTVSIRRSVRDTHRFAERIAVNQQLLLKEESHFDKVTDPSSGSYYIETPPLRWRNSLEAFLETVEKALRSTWQATCRCNQCFCRQSFPCRQCRDTAGTNQYPNAREVMAEKMEEKEKHGCGCNHQQENTPLKKLNTVRLADPFNELRLATEQSGKTPKVFMLTIGNLAMRLARSQFSGNFFACAGYELIDNLGFKTVAEGVQAARDKNADVVVLCSSDDEYVTYAPEASTC